QGHAHADPVAAGPAVPLVYPDGAAEVPVPVVAAILIAGGGAAVHHTVVEPAEDAVKIAGDGTLVFRHGTCSFPYGLSNRLGDRLSACLEQMHRQPGQAEYGAQAQGEHHAAAVALPPLLFRQAVALL